MKQARSYSTSALVCSLAFFSCAALSSSAKAGAQPQQTQFGQPQQGQFSQGQQAQFGQPQQGQFGQPQPGQFAQPQQAQFGQSQPGQFAQPQQAQFGQQQPAVIPDALRRMYNGNGQGQPNGPLVAPPISFVDINSGRFGKLEIDLDDGQFMDGACDNMHVIARNLDLREGVLKSLDLSITGGHFQDFVVDKMTLTTQGSMRFDTGVLLNQKVLQFTQPTQADVTCEISQESLNKFLNAPTTLDRLSVNVSKKVGAIASMFGANAPNVGLTLTSGQVVLGKANRIDINLQTKVGMGEMGMALPVEIQSQLGLVDGWVQAQDTKLMTNGQEISPQLSQMLVSKVNSLASWGTKFEDIHFRFTDLKTKPGKGFVLKGTAEVMRLRLA